LRKPNWDEAIVEAEALFSAGRTREAKAALLELFRKNSCDSRVLNDLAVVAHSENSNLEAMAYLRESLKQNPGDRLTLQNMVDLGAEGTVPS
jgi:Flp pilus assembly protein TadD